MCTPEKEWGTKDTEVWAIVQAGETRGDTGSIPGQANGARESAWSESALASLWHTGTVLSPSFTYMPGLDTEQGHGVANGNPDRLRDQLEVRCVANMLGAEMRLTQALRELQRCYRTSMSVPLKVSSASRVETGFPFTSMAVLYHRPEAWWKDVDSERR